MDDKPFELPLGNVPHRRYNCEGAWTSRDVVFITSTEFLPKRGEQLNWQRLEGESHLARPRSESAGALHSYAATASPALFSGNVLVSAAWFSGEYPPRKEWDELRSEPMAFGHYTLLDRALFIGQSARLPATYLYKADQPEEVREGLQWAFLPDDSSEKTKAHISTIYEIANGYLLRVSQIHDHEGFGVDESEYLYTFQAGRWRFLASAERVRLY
jgi:hypothetical protein